MVSQRYDYKLAEALGTGTALYLEKEKIFFQDLNVWCETPQYTLPGKMYPFGHPFEPFLHRIPTPQLAIFMAQAALNKLSQDLPQISIESIYCGVIEDQPGGFLLAVNMGSISEYFQREFPTKRQI